MVNGKMKGKTGELEFAELLRSFGFEARRGQQYSGIEGKDVVCSLAGVHFEVKRRERLNVVEAMAQAERDAKGDFPIVAHRSNRKPWLVTMKAEDFLRMIRALDLE